MMIVFGPLAGLLDRRFGPKVPHVPRHRLGRRRVRAAGPRATARSGRSLVSGMLTGAGIGLAFAAMSNAIIESVPAAQTGEATSVNTIARTIGSSIGTAVVAAVITSHSTAAGPAHRRRVHRRLLGLRRRRRPGRRRRRWPCPRPAAARAGRRRRRRGPAARSPPSCTCPVPPPRRALKQRRPARVRGRGDGRADGSGR